MRDDVGREVGALADDGQPTPAARDHDQHVDLIVDVLADAVAGVEVDQVDVQVAGWLERPVPAVAPGGLQQWVRSVQCSIHQLASAGPWCPAARVPHAAVARRHGGGTGDRAGALA